MDGELGDVIAAKTARGRSRPSRPLGPACSERRRGAGAGSRAAQAGPAGCAQLLLAHRLQRSRLAAGMHDDARLCRSQAADGFGRLPARRPPTSHWPTVGRTRIPRPALRSRRRCWCRAPTPTLVDWALERRTDAPAPDWWTWAPAAARSRWPSPTRGPTPCGSPPPTRARQPLAVARHNAARLGLRVAMARATGSAAGRRSFERVSNPPYIAGDDPHLPATMRHEPQLALTPGGTGSTPSGLADRRRCGACGPAAGCCSNMAGTRRPVCGHSALAARRRV